MTVTPMKTCSRCHADKPLDDFPGDRTRPDGRGYWCRPCKATANAAWRGANLDKEKASRAKWVAANRERYLATIASWGVANRELVRARSAAWYQENSGRRRAAAAAWRAANPDAVREYDQRHKARRRNAPVNDFSADDWRAVLEDFQHACAYCLTRGIPLEQEHVTPLSRGGGHTRSNIVPACRSCNRRKATRTLLEFTTLGPSATIGRAT